jgi:hypothetical protein
MRLGAPNVRSAEELLAFCRSIDIDYDALDTESKRKASLTLANIKIGGFPQYEGMTDEQRLKLILSSEWSMGFLTGAIARKLYDEG